MYPTEPEIAAMRRCYMFSGLQDAEYQEIASQSKLHVLKAGQVLFAQGDPVAETYWLAEGLVKLTRTSPQGEEKVIELVNPGRTFGEALIFSGSNYPVNGVAQSPSRALGIDVDAFKNWVKVDSERCCRIMAGMSMRLHHLIADIDQLSLMKGSDRLVQYLLDHSDPNEAGELVVELEAPKQVIASRIGVKPETLSRLLHKLTDEKLVAQRGNAIVIIDPQRIQTVQLG